MVPGVLGKMLWFNEEKHLGVIETDEGERLTVRAEDFAGGHPVGRCAGLPVTFEIHDGAAVNVAMNPEGDIRRARQRRPTPRSF
jgi:cold shock CspA family protein